MEFVLIPLVVMIAPVIVILILLRYRLRQAQARYQTLLALADKGVALPPSLLVEPQLAYCERRRALVLIGAGLGLMAMFAALPAPLDNGMTLRSLWGIGLLPLMIGLGYLASWWFNQREDARG